MKKTFLIIIGILSITISNGQNSKFSFGIIGSPDFYNYQFNQNEVTDIKYNSMINYSAGVSAQYNLNEKITTKTGILYSKKDFSADFSWQLFDDVPDPAINDESTMKLGYLEIPVLFSYKLISFNKMSLFASSGLVTSFLINEKEISVMQTGTEKETDFFKILYGAKFNPILLNVDFEIGLNYNLNETVFLSLEPYFRNGLNKLSDEIFKSNPMSYGLRLGVHLKMNSWSN